MVEPKVLLYDIETSPILGACWGMWQQNIMEVVRDWEILSVSWKWFGEKTVQTLTRADTPGKDDRHLCRKVWGLMNKADVVVSFNGLRFDNKKSNTRFLRWGLPPLPKFQNIDLFQVAKRQYGFTSNKMDYICKYLKLPGKIETSGKALWMAAMNGDERALKEMGRYNAHDVQPCLEELYKKLRPHIQNHPNLALIAGRPDACPYCTSPRFRSHGIQHTKTRAYRRFRCLECRGGFTETTCITDLKARFKP